MLIISGMNVGFQCSFFLNLCKTKKIIFYEKYNKIEFLFRILDRNRDTLINKISSEVLTYYATKEKCHLILRVQLIKFLHRIR